MAKEKEIWRREGVEIERRIEKEMNKRKEEREGRREGISIAIKFQKLTQAAVILLEPDPYSIMPMLFWERCMC